MHHFYVKIHPHCGISLSKTDLVQFGTELDVMELNQFLGVLIACCKVSNDYSFSIRCYGKWQADKRVHIFYLKEGESIRWKKFWNAPR